MDTETGSGRQHSAMRLPPIGFWSYSRQDDDLSRGKLSNLRSSLLAEIQQQYGRQPIQLFQDVSTIAHGAEWEEEIRRSLYEATFFIPIITPNFIQSEWCTTEVRIFLERERELCSLYPELPPRSRIFPLLFIDITGVDPHDPAVLAVLEQRQGFDFRGLRHRSFDDERVQHGIAGFAASIRKGLQIKVRTVPPAPNPGPEHAVAHPEPEEVEIQSRQAAAKAHIEEARRNAREELDLLRRETAEMEARRQAEQRAERERPPPGPATVTSPSEPARVTGHSLRQWQVPIAAGLILVVLAVIAFYVSRSSSEAADPVAAAASQTGERQSATGDFPRTSQWERLRDRLKTAPAPVPTPAADEDRAAVTPPSAPARPAADQSQTCSQLYRAARSGTPGQQTADFGAYLRACPNHENRSEAQRRLAEIGRYRDAMQRVMRADERTTSAGSASRVFNLIRGIDLSGTPDDFRRAYRAHVEAWRDRAAAEQAPPGPARQSRLAQIDRRIQSTYQAAAGIAVRYGVPRR